MQNRQMSEKSEMQKLLWIQRSVLSALPSLGIIWQNSVALFRFKEESTKCQCERRRSCSVPAVVTIGGKDAHHPHRTSAGSSSNMNGFLNVFRVNEFERVIWNTQVTQKGKQGDDLIASHLISRGWELRTSGHFGWTDPPPSCHWTSGGFLLRARTHLRLLRLLRASSPGWCQGSWPWTVTSSRSPRRRWICAPLTESVGAPARGLLRAAKVAPGTLVWRAAHLRLQRAQGRTLWRYAARSGAHCPAQRPALLANDQRTDPPPGFLLGNAGFTSNRRAKGRRRLQRRLRTAAPPRSERT